MQAVNTKSQCFVVWSDEIEGRFNPLYFVYKQKVKSLKFNFHLINLGDLLKEEPQYGANEIAINGNPKVDVRYIRITDIEENGKLKQDEWKTAKNIEEKYLLQENDILFARSGATAGKTFIYKKEFGKAIFAGYLIRFKIDTPKASPDYIFYYTQLTPYIEWVKSIQRPSGQPNINSEEFKSIQIPLPPLQTQNRIVEIMESAYKEKAKKEAEAENLLNSIDDYVLDELGIKMPEIKDKMCFAVSSDEVENKRINTFYYQPKFKDAERLLKESKYKIELLKNYITKIHYGASLKNIYIEKGIPLLRIQNLKPNRLSLEDIVNLPETMRKEIGNAFVNEGDILISRSGSVGIVAVVPKEAEGFAFGSFMIKFRLKENINKNYISIWLNNKLARLFTQREKIGAIQGNITISTIENFKIPAPPLEIQNKLVNEVKSRLEKAEKLKSEAKNIVENAKKQVEKIILGKSL